MLARTSLCIAAWCAAVVAASGSAHAQVFAPLGAPGVGQPLRLATATARAGMADAHLVFGFRGEPSTNAGLVLSVVTPPTNSLSIASFLGVAGAFATRPSMAHLGAAPMATWTATMAGVPTLVIARGTMMSPFFVNVPTDVSGSTISCVNTRCLQATVNRTGAVVGHSIEPVNVPLPITLVSPITGTLDPMTPPAPAVLALNPAIQRWLIATSVAVGGARTIRIYRTDLDGSGLPTTIGTALSAATPSNADAPTLTEYAGTVYLAYRSGTSLWVQRISPMGALVGMPVRVPNTDLSSRASLGRGPNGPLLAYVDGARPTVRRLIESPAGLQFELVAEPLLATHSAASVFVSSSDTQPLLVMDTTSTPASVSATYLRTTCINDGDCRVAVSMGAPCAGRCVMGACNYEACTMPADAGIRADAATDSGTNNARDAAREDSAIDATVDAAIEDDASAIDASSLDAILMDSSVRDAANDATNDATSDGRAGEGTPSDLRYGGGACACTVAGKAPRRDRAWFALALAAGTMALRRRRRSRSR